MKKLTLIAMFAAAVAFTGCKKKDEGNKPATTEKPATGTTTTTTTTTPPTGGSAVVPPTGGSAVDPGTGAAVVAPGTPGTTTTTTTTTTPGAPTPSDAEFEAMMGKAVAMFTAMGDAADKAGGDCGKLAASLEKVMADNQGFIDQAKKYKDNPEMDKKGEEWMKAHQDQVMGPMVKVAGAGQKCAGDAKFMAVMEKLGELGN